jgi:hypothetical protein
MRPSLKKEAHQDAINEGISLSDWLERAAMELLKRKVA